MFRFLIAACLLATNVSLADDFPQHKQDTSYSSSKGAVATVHPLATQYAAKQLESGGNAIDAAISAALVLGVVDSYNSGIGGGLFAMVHWADGRVEAIDGREMAPAKAHRDMYLRDGIVVPELSRDGALAIGVPGSVAAFEYLAKAGGKKPLGELYSQAADIAEKGFVLSPSYVKRLQGTKQRLLAYPDASAIFLSPEQKVWPVGYRLKQADLANTYRKLAELGSDYFYRGEFADAVEQWMHRHSGLIRRTDLAQYQLKKRQPVISRFGDYQIYGFPPPSSGGVHVAEILNILESFDVKALSDHDRQHVMVEAMKLAFADRAYWLGDPDFVDVPKGLIAPQYAQQLAKRIQKKASVVSSHSQPALYDQSLFEKHTTHISVADQYGNWVSITTTLNTSFGSKVVIPGTGVLMNNQMDDFSAQPNVPNSYGLVGTEANSIQPKKRPLSSMSPTIVTHNNKPIMAVGAAGGPMIITQVTQALIRYLALDESLYDALAKPRIHQQWKPDRVFIDKTLPAAQREDLESRGHQLQVLRFEGSSNAVSFKDGVFDAVAEPRLILRNAQP